MSSILNSIYLFKQAPTLFTLYPSRPFFANICMVNFSLWRMLVEEHGVGHAKSAKEGAEGAPLRL